MILDFIESENGPREGRIKTKHKRSLFELKFFFFFLSFPFTVRLCKFLVLIVFWLFVVLRFYYRL